MKRMLLSGMLVVGMVMAYPFAVQAYSGEGCYKCAEKGKAAQITKLKKKVGMLWENQEALKITEKQMMAIKDIKHAAIKQLIQYQADKEIVMVDLKSKMREDIIDVDAVNPLIDAKYTAKIRSAKTYARALSDIQNVLDEGQREQWKELFKAFGPSKCQGKCQNLRGSHYAGEKKFCPVSGKSFPVEEKE